MKRKTILISIDHKWRDLAGYVYAKKLFEQLGYKVILIRNGFELHYANVFNPVAVVMIHLYDLTKSKIVKELNARNISVFLMPTEGIPTLGKMRKLAGGYFSDLSDVRLNFVWNNEIKKILLKNKTIKREKIFVTGVPRFDFYCKPLKETLLNKEVFFKKYKLKEKNYKIITWATNFTNAGFYKKNMVFLKKDWKTLQVDKILNPEKIAFQDFQSRELLFKKVTHLLSDIKDIYLIIKLHPSEEHLFYEKEIKKLPPIIAQRIRIIRQEYIWDVLNSTDILLKRSCTTGVEAWSLNKPTIELHLNPKEWYYSPEHASGSDEVKNYTQLKKTVLSYLRGNQISSLLLNKRNQFIKKWCYKLDGLSTKRFVQAIHLSIKKSKKIKKLSFFSFSFLKSFLLVTLLEWTDFYIHDIKVYGFWGTVDKLGRQDKYFHRRDERYWEKRLKEL